MACTRADCVMKRAEGGFELRRLLASCEINEKVESDFIDLDVLIMHEGAMDLMAKHPGVKWEAEMCPKLWKIAPWVVRTSGRGRATKHLQSWLPFIEFNEVSAAMLTGRNKHALVRGLLGASGMDPEPANDDSP